MSDNDPGTGRAPSRKEIADELLSRVNECAEAYHLAAENDRAKARERYIRALDEFNAFVLSKSREQVS